MSPKFLMLLAIVALTGCSSYVAPAGGVAPVALTGATGKDGRVLSDVGDINANFDKKPAARFPASVAVARVQASGYQSQAVDSYGRGRYSVVTVREVEQDADVERLTKMPGIGGVAMISRLLIPPDLQTDRELRVAASKIHADMLLLYSFDVGFRVDEQDIGPLGVITLGLLPNREAKVTSTCAAALFDVRTGFIYGTAEATAEVKQRANAWTDRGTVDRSRLEAQRKSFEKLLPEIERMWSGVASAYGNVTASK